MYYNINIYNLNCNVLTRKMLNELLQVVIVYCFKLSKYKNYITHTYETSRTIMKKKNQYNQFTIQYNNYRLYYPYPSITQFVVCLKCLDNV